MRSGSPTSTQHPLGLPGWHTDARRARGRRARGNGRPALLRGGGTRPGPAGPGRAATCDHAADHLAGALAQAPDPARGARDCSARLAARRAAAAWTSSRSGSTPSSAPWWPARTCSPPPAAPPKGSTCWPRPPATRPARDWAGVPWVTAPELAERLDPDRAARILMQVCAARARPGARRRPRPPLRAVPHAGPQRGHRAPRARPAARRGVRAGPAARRGRRSRSPGPPGGYARSRRSSARCGSGTRTAAPAGPARRSPRSAGPSTHDPDDLAVYADIAGTLADNGRLDEALDWIDRALARDPSFDCAVHTAHRLRLPARRRRGPPGRARRLRPGPPGRHATSTATWPSAAGPALARPGHPGRRAVVDALRQAVAADDGSAAPYG